MSRILFFILFLLSTCAIFPEHSLDHKAVKIDSLLRLSHQAYVDVNILTSMEHALEALSLSEKSNYSEGRARSYFYIAQALSSVGDYN